MSAVFFNRQDAGQKIAKQLIAYANNPNAIVLGLPRGGVPIAYELAKYLHLPLDVCLVRKLSLPDNPEMAMGAIAEDALLPNDGNEITIIDQNITKRNRLQPEKVQAIAEKEKAELRWRESLYRPCRPMLTISKRTVIVTDDGMATGLTMLAAVQVLRQHKPAKIIIALPVSSQYAITNVKNQVEDLICLTIPKSLGAVGLWYEDFSQVTNREVCNFLNQRTFTHLTRSC